MSITDDVRGEARTPAGPPVPPQAPRDGQFDKTPPQDIAAEQCVLGGMLLSKDAIADVVEILKPGDFYRPVHARIFDAVLDLYGRGEPADPITVAAALADSGDLARIGGAPYLHTLISSVPTAANAAYYARIVGERAVLRRLVEAGTRIVQLGYGSAAGGGRDVDDVVDLAQQAVYDVTERRVSEDFAVLADMLQPTLDEIEAVGAQGGVMTGVPTGFTDLDRLLNGLHPGQLIIVAGRPGLGKALALDTPLPTPTGWTSMGEVAVGDQLLGADGRPTTVTAAFDVRYGRPCYEVEFSDGTVIVADAEHLWRTSTLDARLQPAGRWAAPARDLVDGPGGSGVVTTERIAATLWTTSSGRAQAADPDRGAGTGSGHRRPNHAVRNCEPLVLPERDLPIPPYALGTWLGGGDPAPTRARGSFLDLLHGLGVVERRHVPPDYLRAAEPQRRALLAGLLDADGTVAPAGTVRYRATSRRLARDVRELVSSLGYRSTLRVTTDRVRGATSPVYQLDFPARDDVFRLERKVSTHRARRAGRSGGADTRTITGVRPVASVPVRCVTVDNDEHLYLAGPGMVPTHNSTASMDFARHAAIRHNCASAIFSLEMSKVEIVMRLLSAEARVPLHVLRSGQLSDDDWTKLARRMGEISEAPLFVDDTPNMNLMEIRAKARRLKQRHDLKMIVVDYLQLMSSPKRTESRQQEVAELSRGLKLLAKEVECPVIAVSQLNRGPEQRTDKRPQLSDLRESGCLTAGTRVIRADNNAEVTLGELLAAGATDIPVWALDDRLMYTPRTMTHVFPSGTREVFRMTLSSGKTIEATANHPFLTFDGWLPLGELTVGTRLAAPRHIPPPLNTRPGPAAEVVTLAHQLGCGSEGSRERVVPQSVFRLPKTQITLFLRHLWAAGGSVTVDEIARDGHIRFPSPGPRLLEDISRLLLRYGITTRLTNVTGGEHQPRYVLDVSGRDDQLRFLREIGVPGEQAGAVERLRTIIERGTGNANTDAIRGELWGRVREILTEQDTTHHEFAGSSRTRSTGSLVTKRPPVRLTRIAAVLDTADLDLHATNDVFWDEIASIESLGERDVYDATVLGTHNFIANGIATHNSIEQDADVVILLHRDDYYDKESPRAGEADFIVAKHRNGPTDTVTVAAQLHLSRFVDMAIV